MKLIEGKIVFIFVMLNSFCNVFPQLSEANPVDKRQDVIAQYGLESCHDNKLQIEFLCNPQWDFRLVEDALLIIVSTKPAVTVTFAKIDSKISFLSQLTRNSLLKKNLYAEGFRTEQIQINQHNALVIRAFAKNDADRRLLDYFFIHRGNLFGVLFSVHPKDDWDEYKFLIKTIAESIKFYDGSYREAS